jgi:hypothetical protein
MKFECEVETLKILWHFPQQADVQKRSYEMGNMKNLQE